MGRETISSSDLREPWAIPSARDSSRVMFRINIATLIRTVCICLLLLQGSIPERPSQRVGFTGRLLKGAT